MVANRRATAAQAAMSAAAWCYVTAEVLPVGLLTVMAADLGRTHAQIGLLVTTYAAVVVAGSLPLVRLTRRVPRRYLLAAALATLAAATAGTALVTSYPLLLAARVATGLSQALFWAIAAPTAAGMVPAAVRGRAVARLSVGASLGPVLGVPAGTWLGQQYGWRAAFAALAVVCLAVFAAVTALVPTVAPGDEAAATGAAPSRRRYLALIVITVLAVTGALTAFTYQAPFLIEVSGFAAPSLGALLLVGGSAGAAGSVLAGRVLDRWPVAALRAPLAALALALLGLFALGTVPAPALALLALTSLAFGVLPPAFAHRSLQVAPGGTDMAAAGLSMGFNVGIAGGSLLGAALIGWTGPRGLALAGGLLAAGALAVALGLDRRGQRPARSGPLAPVRPRTPAVQWRQDRQRSPR